MTVEFGEGAVLVIGGSGGVGRVVAREFAVAGTDVAVTYNTNVDAADAVVGQVEGLGRQASSHQLTIGDAARVDAVMEEVVAVHGKIHTIVIGAGSMAEQVYVAEMTREQWGRVIDQDLNGFYNIVHASLKRFRDWGGGSYVHLSSAGLKRWPDRDVMSVAPKAAIESLIQGIAREEGRYGIRANSVLLGVIEAGMFLKLTEAGHFPQKWVDEVQNNLAIKRWGRPEEVAQAAIYLASTGAGYVTGQQIAVAGGYGI